jgi:hypothetical protein
MNGQTQRKSEKPSSRRPATFSPRPPRLSRPTLDEQALRDYLADRIIAPLGPHKLTGYDIPRRHLPPHLQ